MYQQPVEGVAKEKPRDLPDFTVDSNGQFRVRHDVFVIDVCWRWSGWFFVLSEANRNTWAFDVLIM